MYLFVPLCFLNEHLCTLSECIVFIFFFFSVAMNEFTLVSYKSLWYNQNKSPTRRPFMLDVTKEEFGSKTLYKCFVKLIIQYF